MSGAAHMLPHARCRPSWLCKVAGGSFQLRAAGCSSAFHTCVAGASLTLAAGRQNNERAALFAPHHWTIPSAVS